MVIVEFGTESKLDISLSRLTVRLFELICDMRGGIYFCINIFSSLFKFECLLVYFSWILKPWGTPGGVLELFFDGVCGQRSETLTHI